MKEICVSIPGDDYLTKANATYLRDTMMSNLVDNMDNKRLAITLKMGESRLKVVFYHPILNMMQYVDEFINNVLKFTKRRECFSHSRDHKVSMYYFLNHMHYLDRVRI